MTYYHLIRKILKNSKKPLNVREIWEEVRKTEKDVKIERIYMVLGKMVKRNKVIKEKKKSFNYYFWKEENSFNKNNINKYSYETKQKSLDNNREFQGRGRERRENKNKRISTTIRKEIKERSKIQQG